MQNQLRNKCRSLCSDSFAFNMYFQSVTRSAQSSSTLAHINWMLLSISHRAFQHHCTCLSFRFICFYFFSCYFFSRCNVCECVFAYTYWFDVGVSVCFVDSSRNWKTLIFISQVDDVNDVVFACILFFVFNSQFATTRCFSTVWKCIFSRF